MEKKKIIIVGGGFAGVKCAKVLSAARKEVEVTLFNPENFMLFTPLLADVAGSSLSPRAVAASLRQMLPRVRCRAETVAAVNPAENTIEYTGFNSEQRSMAYDELVLAVGNRVDLGRVPGMVDHAIPLKTIGDAIALRRHVMERLEQADATDDAELRQWLLSFVVIGGGFSGVEVAGELNDLALHALKYYPNIERDLIKVSLVHSRRQILPEVSSALRDFAGSRMARAGINLVLEARASTVTRKGVKLQDGQFLEGGTIVCTVGNCGSILAERMAVEKERGRFKTETDMRLLGHDNIWAVGDCALIHNAQNDKLSPPTAQFAERQGGQVAANIKRKLKGEPTRPFKFKLLGVAAGIGGRKGVAELFGVRVSGFFAFWLWRSAFLIKLPSFLQKIKVGLDWSWELVFPREISNFIGAPSQPIGHAFFAEGEVIFESDTMGKTLYAIEKGECEIVLLGVEGKVDRVLVVLGRGEMIGPHTLKSYSDQSVCVRARVNTEVIALAADFLQRMSSVLKPVEDMLRRSMLVHDPLSVFSGEARAILEASSCGEIMRPAPDLSLAPDLTLLGAFRALREADQPFSLIIEDQRLSGIITRTDLIRGLDHGVEVQVKKLMSVEPLAVCLDDAATIAATTMRDKGLKWMPVISNARERQVEGVLYVEDLVAHVADGLGR